MLLALQGAGHVPLAGRDLRASPRWRGTRGRRRRRGRTLIRCHECGVAGRDEGSFRPYYPDLSSSPRWFCPLCWQRRERRQLRDGLAIGAGLLLAGLLAAVFSPLGQVSELARLGLVFLGSYGLSVAAHEVGHGLVALALGFRVHGASLGYGPALLSRRLGGLRIDLRCYPVCGEVRVSSRAQGFARLRHAVVSLAGPLVNAVLLVLGLALAAPLSPGGLSPGDVSAAHLLALANALILLFNLAPLAYPDDARPNGRWTPTDGLQALRSLFAPPEAVAAWVEAGLAADAEALVAQGRLEDARRLLGERSETAAESPLRILLRARIALAEGRPRVALDLLEVPSRAADLPPGLRARLLTGRARAALAVGDAALADSASREAVGLDAGSAEARAARGDALLARGHVAQAEVLFRGLRADASEPRERALACCRLARAREAAGAAEEARSLRDEALALDPTCPELVGPPPAD
ncbi:MAG: hypothetical protein D6731_10365 [Planctomycetota bacterium]|nr:MAG: hypothetical protein D6731_10365 [Planctomycetota bacterium]